MKNVLSKLAAVTIGAVVAIAGFSTTSAQADVRYNPNKTVSRSLQNLPTKHRNHNYSNRDHRGGYVNHGPRRYYGNSHRNRGVGIYLNLGSNSSPCNYSYRKWKSTGSWYWRNRYNNCVG